MLDREINQQSTKLPPYFVFCFGITYDCVKRVQASNNTLLDKPVNGVACPSNVESEAPNMRIDIQKRNMQQMQAQICDRCLSDNMTVLAPVATSDGYQVPESHYIEVL